MQNANFYGCVVERLSLGSNRYLADYVVPAQISILTCLGMR